MKIYVATFHGDLEEHPMVNVSLDNLLLNIQGKYGFGKQIEEEDGIKIDWESYYAPDPEDDKIEIWEYDSENYSARVVWGFWGWHWSIPEGLTQGKLPGDEKTLYEKAMVDY